MAKVRAFAIDGLKLWFPSDDHEPPHFHAKRGGEWEVRVRFLMDEIQMFQVKWLRTKAGMSKQDRQRIIEMVNAHRRELIQEWESIHP